MANPIKLPSMHFVSDADLLMSYFTQEAKMNVWHIFPYRIIYKYYIKMKLAT